MISVFNQLSHRRKTWVISGAVGVLVFFILFVSFLVFKANTVSRFSQIQAAQSNNTVFFDIDRKPFHIIRGIENRKYVKLKYISRKLQMAVVAIEDSRFFQHFGFDPIRIAAVIIRLLKKDATLQGASTITQQLVKLTLLSPEVTLSRKIKELFMAVALEMEYSKAEILEFYLNKVYLGHRNYGVENVSLNYFHKPTSELTLAESVFIAGLIKKPEGYSPFVNLKMARIRQILVLKRMKALKWITRKEFMAAVNERILIRQRRQSGFQIAPYFTNHILLRLKQKYGHKLIYGGGLRIYTTLDRKMQRAMEQVKGKRLAEERSFEEIAGVSFEPATGFVKAMVGGADFHKSEFNRVTQAKRQPGSSFKPILYATTLAQGVKPNEVFWDEPTQYTRAVGDEVEIYEPGNISGEHLGQITMSYALRISNNVVSVQLLNKIGIQTLVRSAERFGIKLPGERGLCLALGCGELTLLQLVGAYSVFANQGYRNEPVFVLKITDSQGKVLEKYQPQKEIQVISQNQAFQMNRMLQDVVNFGTGRNARTGMLSGGKTGTSDNNRDAWYVGFTPDLVTGFWVGNDDNTPMDNELGGRTPARLWRSYMQSIPAPAVQKGFAINENFEEFLICNNSGKLATELCPRATWYALSKSEPPLEYCEIHNERALEFKICRTSGKLASQYCPVSEIATERFFPGTEPLDFCDEHVDEASSAGQAYRREDSMYSEERE
ncbi:MAG: PBP1A family penicillin-binding protein [Proteobacteria bacterium]|nr:PBP1A family penicillin-binding protein [Pseudomonadota bacterium]